jgi:hypothetical protein
MEDWIKIFSTDKMYKINLVKGMLASSNIVSKEISSKDSSFLLGTIDLYVHPDQANEAKEIIKRSTEL